MHEALRAYAVRGATASKAYVGRYVLMPDHLPIFVRGAPSFRLGVWEGGLKRALSVPLLQDGHPLEHWQPGFFDHLLRNAESYEEKWEYVRRNPVRAGLVRRAEDWPFQGEIVRIDWAF